MEEDRGDDALETAQPVTTVQGENESKQELEQCRRYPFCFFAQPLPNMFVEVHYNDEEMYLRRRRRIGRKLKPFLHWNGRKFPERVSLLGGAPIYQTFAYKD